MKGYVSLVVEGKAIERFINLAVSRGIRIWDVKYLGRDKVILRVRWSAVWALRHIARVTTSRFRITGKVGFPFFLWRVRRRKMLCGGALLFVATVYLLSSIIWAVDVSGAKRTDPLAVSRVARNNGLRVGTIRWQINEKNVAQAIREQFPVLSWVGVDVRGTRASITVVEKKLPAAMNHPAHIIARKAGLIQELLVLEGQPQVKEGDTVSPGQVLISGEVFFQGGEEPGIAYQIRGYTRAKGIVRARVWYQGYGEAALHEGGERRSGRFVRAIGLMIGKRWFRLYGPQESPYSHYRVEVAKKALQWRNFNVPVEFINRKYVELVPYEIRRSPADARRLAQAGARRSTYASMPIRRRILREDVEEVRTVRPEQIVRVRFTVEVIEEIGICRDFAR